MPLAPNLAQRKIYFHKVSPRLEQDDAFALDREGVIDAMTALHGTADFYFDEGDEQYLCAVADDAGAPQRFRFYRVRRRNLPETEEDGTFEELLLDERRGLAESIHVVLFDDNVLGSEYNHYGARVSLLPTFLNERCGTDIKLKQLVRRDVMNTILNLQEIRVLRVKVEPGAAAVLQQRQGGLGGAFDAAELFSAGKYMDLTLASTSDDQGFTQRVKDFFRGIRDNHEPPESVVSTAQVYGATHDGDLEWLDLLKDRVVLSAEIERETPRSRALDKDAAYAAIIEAHDQVQADLDAGTIVPEL